MIINHKQVNEVNEIQAGFNHAVAGFIGAMFEISPSASANAGESFSAMETADASRNDDGELTSGLIVEEATNSNQ